MDTAVDLHVDGGGWINSNLFNGMYVGCTTTLHYRGSGGECKANEFHGVIQPHGANSAGTQSDVGWKLDHGEANIIDGYVWDPGRFATASWSVASDADVKDNVIVTSTDLSNLEGDVGKRGNTVRPERALDLGSIGRKHVAIGRNTTVNGHQSALLGDGAVANQFAVALGNEADADTFAGIALGERASVSSGQAIAIGWKASNETPKTAFIKGNVKLDRAFVDSGTTTAYTTDPTDEIVGVSTNAAPVTVILDATSSNDEGHVISITDESGSASTNPITIDPVNDKSIDGNQTQTVDTNRGSIRAYCDGSDWHTI
jgi:hypothetical protein